MLIGSHSFHVDLLLVLPVFIYLGFYVAFNTVQVISRRVVGRAEETSTYSLLGFCTVNCRPTVSNYQLSHLRPCRESNPGLRGEKRECYCWAPTRGREQLELFIGPTSGGELWQTSRDVLPHLEWVLRQLYPMNESNYIELNLCRRKCYEDNQR